MTPSPEPKAVIRPPAPSDTAAPAQPITPLEWVILELAGVTSSTLGPLRGRLEQISDLPGVRPVDVAQGIDYKVSRMTVTRALNRLAKIGFIARGILPPDADETVFRSHRDGFKTSYFRTDMARMWIWANRTMPVNQRHAGVWPREFDRTAFGLKEGRGFPTQDFFGMPQIAALNRRSIIIQEMLLDGPQPVREIYSRLNPVPHRTIRFTIGRMLGAESIERLGDDIIGLRARPN